MATLAQDVIGAQAPSTADLQVLAAWAPEIADTFVALSCDIALVIDSAGRIARISQNEAQPIAPASWLGRPWLEVVAPDSRRKAEQLLADVAHSGHGARREINHAETVVGALPLACSAARLGDGGPVLAVGHDLRAQALLQQRFLAAQEALERSYWNAQGRQIEKATSRKVPAADPALVDALGRLVERIVQEQLPGPPRNARRLAELHFLARAIERAGSPEALVRALGPTKRPLSRRSKR